MRLSSNLSPQSIQNLVVDGVPIGYFEGSKEDMDKLSRFVSSRQDMQRRLTPVVKTELVFKQGKPSPVATAPATKSEDTLALTKALYSKGVSFELAASLVEANEKDIKKVEGYAEVLEVLGLPKNASGKKIYDAIRDHS